MKSFQKCGEVGGGTFIADFVSGRQSQASFGAATDILLTPPTGQRVLLTALSSASALTLVNIDVGTRNIVIDLTLEAGFTDADGEFVISNGQAVGLIDFQGVQPPILGEIDEAVRVFKVAGTAVTVFYSYMFGE